MARKKVLKIPLDRFYKEEADKKGISYKEKGLEAHLNVADIVKRPLDTDLIISGYYVNVDTCKDKTFVFHFSEYHCAYMRESFFNHLCLCVHEGVERWHKPGNCKVRKSTIKEEK